MATNESAELLQTIDRMVVDMDERCDEALAAISKVKPDIPGAVSAAHAACTVLDGLAETVLLVKNRTGVWLSPELERRINKRHEELSDVFAELDACQAVLRAIDVRKPSKDAMN